MLLARDKSQLLIVDVQPKLLGAISGKDRLVERCFRLISAAKTLGVPITISEQYPQGLGPTVEPLHHALGNEGVIMEKVEFSCLKNECLRERLHDLRRQGRSQVVVGGIEAHICVAQTAIELEEQGFEAVLPPQYGRSVLAIDDWVVTARNVSQLDVSTNMRRYRMREIWAWENRHWLPLRTTNADASAGFYSHHSGYVPFAWSREPVERVQLGRVVRAFGPRAPRAGPAGEGG